MRDRDQWVPNAVAIVIISAFLITCGWLITVASEDADVWDHHLKVFAAVAPAAGTAVGWVFGREVHRRAAQQYRRDALNGRELAGWVKALGAGPPTVDAMNASAQPSSGASGGPERFAALVQRAEELFPAEKDADANGTAQSG